jgi:hypothetical protein
VHGSPSAESATYRRSVSLSSMRILKFSLREVLGQSRRSNRFESAAQVCTESDH